VAFSASPVRPPSLPLVLYGVPLITMEEGLGAMLHGKHDPHAGMLG